MDTDVVTRRTSRLSNGGGRCSSVMGPGRLGVAICNYQASRDSHVLNINVGDLVLVEGGDNDDCDWFHGCVVADRDKKGIFPKSFVALKESASSMDILQVKDHPLLMEVVRTLKEWWSLLQDRYVSVGSSDEVCFQRVIKVMDELMVMRREVKSQVKDIHQHKSAIINKLEIGNALLGLDIVVRDDAGHILNPTETSTITFFKRHEEAMKRIDNFYSIYSSPSSLQVLNDSQTSRRSSNVTRDSRPNGLSSLAAASLSAATIGWSSGNLQLSLLVRISDFVARLYDDADLLFFLFDGREMKPLTESFLIYHNKSVGQNEQFVEQEVAFTDLGSNDLKRDRIVLVCFVIRVGSMEMRDPNDRAISTNGAFDHNTSRLMMPYPSKKPSSGLRRPFGVAAMDVTDIITGKTILEEDNVFNVPIMACTERESLEATLRRLLTSKTLVAADINLKASQMRVTSSDGQFFSVSYKLLTSGHQDIPSSLTRARKMGFPDIILPSDVRNDLFVTLSAGEFYSKGAGKNFEVTVKVADSKGQTVSGLVSMGRTAGEAGTLEEYRSVIYRHDDHPKWSESLKVTLDSVTDLELHLKFLFKHRSSTESRDKNEKPFGLAYLPLVNHLGVAVPDGVHNLIVYKVEKKFDWVEDPSYLRLPATRNDLDNLGLTNQKQKASHLQSIVKDLTVQLKDSFTISTVMCSTKLTQNVHLMGLLSLEPKHLDQPDIIARLEAFTSVDGEEVVKFLDHCLDRLFCVLADQSSTPEIDQLVFRSLVSIIGFMSTAKYQNFRQVMDVYIKDRFSWTLAHDKLIHQVRSHFNNMTCHPLEDTSATFADSVMDALVYLIKFIVRSRFRYSEIEGGKGRAKFEAKMEGLFVSFTQFVSVTRRDLTYLQDKFLKIFPTAIPDILTVYDAAQLSYDLYSFLSEIRVDHLKESKMTYILNIVHTDCLFGKVTCRANILSAMTDHIKTYLSRFDDSVMVPKCVDVLSEVMRVLHPGSEGRVASTIADGYSDARVIMFSCLKTILEGVIHFFGSCPTDQPSTDQVILRQMVAILLSILRMMTPTNYREYFDHFDNDHDRMDFIMKLLMVIKNLVSQPVFRSDCGDLIVHQSQVILSALKQVSKAIRDLTAKKFEYQIWNNFFHTTISFLTQPCLQLEVLPAYKKGRILSMYGDIRSKAAAEVRSMWYYLGSNKGHFVPELVGPFIEMTLVADDDVRASTIPIFFDMMLVEMATPDPKGQDGVKGHFGNLQREMITQLDALVEAGKGDDDYKEQFGVTLGRLWEPHAEAEMGLIFVQTIVRLFKRLLEYRQVVGSGSESRDIRMLCIAKILEFYHEIGRQEMHIRYLYKLLDLHKESGHFVEAGHTLYQHARLLNWSDDPLPTVLRTDLYPDCLTHRDLKQQLFVDIINFFDQGQLWEEAIRRCKELAHLYDYQLYDYLQLSNLLRKMSDFYGQIMEVQRPQVVYFRLSFYGLGFPPTIANRTFICRGKEYERLADFESRVKMQHPMAVPLRSLSAPTEEIKNDPNGQFFLATSVNPIMRTSDDLKSAPYNLVALRNGAKWPNNRIDLPSCTSGSIPEKIVNYYKANEVQKFAFSRPLRKDGKGSDNEFASMWIEKTTFETSYPLPGILTMFPVTKMSVVELSPLEAAIESVEGTNQELMSIILDQLRDPMSSVHTLNIRLKGVIEASVNGGIGNYEKAFFTDDFIDSHPKDGDLLARLKSLFSQQSPLLEFGLSVEKEKILADPKLESLWPLHGHLEQLFKTMKVSLESKYGRSNVPDELLVASLKKSKEPMTFFPSPEVASPIESSLTSPRKSSSSYANKTWGKAAETVTRKFRSRISEDKKAEATSSARKPSSTFFVNDLTSSKTDCSNGLMSLSTISLSESLSTQRPPRPTSEHRLSGLRTSTFDEISTGLSDMSLNYSTSNETINGRPAIPPKKHSSTFSQSLDLFSDYQPRRTSHLTLNPPTLEESTSSTDLPTPTNRNPPPILPRKARRNAPPLPTN